MEFFSEKNVYEDIHLNSQFVTRFEHIWYTYTLTNMINQHNQYYVISFHIKC